MSTTAGASRPAGPDTAARRRGVPAAFAFAALGLALTAVASSARWVTAVPASPDVPGSARVALDGGTLLPSLVPLALVGVAGLVAALAAGPMLRGTLRVLACLFVVAAGVALAVAAGGALTDLAAAVRDAEAARSAAAAEPADASPVGWLAVAGGVLLAGAGAVGLARGRGWPGLGARYDRDSGGNAGGAAPRRPAATTWDALERGEDPTR